MCKRKTISGENLAASRFEKDTKKWVENGHHRLLLPSSKNQCQSQVPQDQDVVFKNRRDDLIKRNLK